MMFKSALGLKFIARTIMVKTLRNKNRKRRNVGPKLVRGRGTGDMLQEGKEFTGPKQPELVEYTTVTDRFDLLVE